MPVIVLPGTMPGVRAVIVEANVTEPARFSRALDLAVWSVIAALLSTIVGLSVGALPAHLNVVVTVTVALVVRLGSIVPKGTFTFGVTK